MKECKALESTRTLADNPQISITPNINKSKIIIIYALKKKKKIYELPVTTDGEWSTFF